MAKIMDDLERMEQSACLLAECGTQGAQCWVLQEVLDKMIESVGPWWIANYLETSENKVANNALESYLDENWPAEAEIVDQLRTATHWRSAMCHLEDDFGGD